MNLIIGFVPAIFWGILPIWIKAISKQKHNFFNQLIGTTLGTVIISFIIKFLFNIKLINIDNKNFWLFLFSGFFWSIGQIGQYNCYEKLGVSSTLPISTALQIIGNSLIGGFILGEWHNSFQIAKNLFSLFLIVVSIFFINGIRTFKRNQIRDYLILIATTIGYWCYSALPNLSNVQSAVSGFIPQAFGMFLSSILIGSFFRNKIDKREIVKNISAGLIFAAAAIFYLISLKTNGLARAFILTQLSVVISTVFGGIIFNEIKSNLWYRVLSGLSIMIFGVFLMSFKF